MLVLNTSSFEKMLPNLTCVLIYSLAKLFLKKILKTVLSDGRFVKRAKIYSWQSLLLRKLY